MKSAALKLELVRAVTFHCAHSYRVKSWSDEENLKEFGACFSPTGHGHTYRLEAFVTGPVDEVTGMMINLKDLDKILKEAVSLLDGKFLDKEVGEFLDTVPTTEKISLFLFQRLKSALSQTPARLFRLRLFETNDLWVECSEEI
jgi:6-pyruvoyltetrahydropterin/6-carboxytetrahydropterin synthase